MIDTKKYVRKPLFVDAVRVTSANFNEIAKWCQGEIEQDEVENATPKPYIKVRVHNPKNPRQTKAFVGDWLLYTERGYKVYTNKAFHGSFDPTEYVNSDPAAEREPNLGDPIVPDPADPVEGIGAIHATATKVEEVDVVHPPAAEIQPTSEMAKAKALIEADGGTLEPATAEALSEVISQNEAATLAAGKRVLSLEEQNAMDQDEVRELIQSGEAVLAQDLA